MKFEPFSIGRYYFEELLAKGGMGEIYLVKVTGAQGFEKRFAVKRLVKSGSNKGNSALAFQQEAKVCSLLTHHNIAQVFDFVRTGKTSLLIMEYVNGRDLSQILRQAKLRNLRLPIPFGVYIAAQVARGLEFAHTKKHPETQQPLGIIHRDISPQNIMISIDGNVKLIDFGVARIDRQPFKTATGFIKGKPRYMSPEQARGHTIDQRTDLYGLGLVLLETLSGHSAFSGNSHLETFKKVQNGLWDQELLKNNLVPERLEKTIRRCLSLNPEERQRSALELGSELDLFLRMEYPGYGEHDLAAYHSELFEGAQRSYDRNREVVPFSADEKRCMERGGLEESSLGVKSEESESLLRMAVESLWHSELRWLVGVFAGALVLSGTYLAFQLKGPNSWREMASLQGCSEEYAKLCSGKTTSDALNQCIQEKNEKLSEPCRSK